jgi:hypothetical protein
MEKVYKKGNKFFGMSSGLMYTRDQVHEAHPGCYWHGHAHGMPVIEVEELYETKDTRTHGGFPMYPSQRDSGDSATVRKPKGGLKGRGGV